MNKIIQKRRVWEGSPFPELYEDTPRTPFCESLAIGIHNSELILVHHLHEVALQFIHALSNSYRIRKIIGIPYSSVYSVVEELSRSFDVVVPDNLSDISEIVKQEVSSASSNLIIEEVGGYTADISDFLDESKHVLGVVEDTAQGHWMWQKTKLDRLPVLSIAYSSLKRIEDKFIAQSIIDGLAHYLHESGLKPIQDQRILILGFGNVGEKLCKYLRGMCKSLSVYDTDPIQLSKASNDYKIGRDFSDVDIILGVTGKQAVTINDANNLNTNTLLVSGSSKRVEFHPALHGIVNNGEPINFRYSFVPSKILDLVYGSLLYCINKIDGGYPVKGLHNLSPSEENEIISGYNRICQQQSIQ